MELKCVYIWLIMFMSKLFVVNHPILDRKDLGSPFNSEQPNFEFDEIFNFLSIVLDLLCISIV